MSANRIEAAALDAAIGAWADERRLPDAYLARWQALAESDRAAIYNIASTLRLRTGQFVTAFEFIDEIAVREGKSAAQIIARSEIRRIVEGTSGTGSTPGRARELIETFRGMRFPRLTRIHERVEAAVAAIGLPREIRVILPHELGSDEVKVEISAHGGAELERLIAELSAKRSRLGKIAEMVGSTKADDDEI
jgi:hypothetical protein